MGWINRPFDYYGTSPTQIYDDLNEANNNFEILSYAFINNDPTTSIVKNADKLDGYHASSTPTPNTIPVANDSGKIIRDWLAISFLSLLGESNFTFQAVAFSVNTIYQETESGLFLFSYRRFYIKLGPSSPPTFIQLTFNHNYATTESSFGLFVIPKNWYWVVTVVEPSTESGTVNGLWKITISQ